MSLPALPSSPVLHSPAEVLSSRHWTSWMLLALAAGSVNAGALLVCERFVTHVTGTLTRIGVDAHDWVLLLDYGLVVLSFVGGAMASVLAIHARALRGKRPVPFLPLAAVSGVLVSAGLAGHLGVFGPIGGQVEEPADFAFLCVVAFAMGLMNASVATTTALSVRTTHMTGPATDFGVHLASAFLTVGEERRSALRMAALRGGKLVSFALGAGLMVPAVHTLGYAAFTLPALVVLAAALRSFLPARRSMHERATAASSIS